MTCTYNNNCEMTKFMCTADDILVMRLYDNECTVALHTCRRFLALSLLTICSSCLIVPINKPLVSFYICTSSSF